MKHDVFIVHAGKDRSIADAICGKLESAGLTYWAPVPEASAGEERMEETLKAIESSRVIVVVLSENANADPVVKRKIVHAYYTQRLIIPFRLGAAVPRREFLFYLGKARWFNAVYPLAEEHLEALKDRIKELVPETGITVDALALQSETKKTLTPDSPITWTGSVNAPPRRTLGILKWASIATILCSVGWALWFTLRPQKEGGSLAQTHRGPQHRSDLTPTSSQDPGGKVAEPKQASSFPNSVLWEKANESPTPLVGPLVQPPEVPSVSPSEDRPTMAASSPPIEATEIEESTGEQVGAPPLQPGPGNSPPARKRLSRDHRQQYPGTQVKEARRIADLENQRSSLRSQLKETEAKLDLLTSQRDELRIQLRESEERTQVAQKNAETVATRLDALREKLVETEKSALAAQKNEELIRSNLQSQLQETKDEAEKARQNADRATLERDALQIELSDVREQVKRAETQANLAANEREAMESELKKTQEEIPREKTSQTRRGADLTQVQNRAPDFQSQEVRPDTGSAHETAGFVQAQPPNPGPDAKPVPLTQALESTGPSH